MVQIITGDLLEATEKYIVHQTNCVSQGHAAGLAYYLFRKYPYADVYANRKDPDRPGTCIISGNGEDQRFIVNLMGQYYPGSITTSKDIDNEAARKTYFHHALIRLSKLENLESIAFPYKIGCGIAGGDWEWYYGTIANFADFVNKKQNARVVIYQREGDV
jgi:O-acetyl-ADP-ribose deacetylase (regulator of RNase III)